MAAVLAVHRHRLVQLSSFQLGSTACWEKGASSGLLARLTKGQSSAPKLASRVMSTDVYSWQFRVFSYYPMKIGDCVSIGAGSIVEAASIGHGVEIGTNCIIVSHRSRRSELLASSLALRCADRLRV